MPRPKLPSDAETLRRRALARWENEGGAEPCGPQVPRVPNDCDAPNEAGPKGKSPPAK